MGGGVSLPNLDIGLGFADDITEGLKKVVNGPKEAADNARKQGIADQAQIEHRLYNKAQLDKAQEEMAKSRQLQKSKMAQLGGRSGTILTRGLNASQGQMDAGKKVLLGE